MNFDDWATNNTTVTAHLTGMEDFESSGLFPDFVTISPEYPGMPLFQNPSSNWWWFNELAVLQEADINQIGVLSSTFSSYIVCDRVRVDNIDGIKSFTFDYRTISTDNFNTIYVPASWPGWTNVAVESFLRCTDTSPGKSYLSMFARYKDLANYYEYRLGRVDTNYLNLAIFRTSGTAVSNLTRVTFAGSMTNYTHQCKLVAVTNNNGSVYLEAYYNGELKLTYTDSDFAAIRNTSASTVGFLTREADIAVDSVSTKAINIQRFWNWMVNVPGTYTNSDWVIAGGYPTNNACTLPKRTDTQYVAQAFDSWSTPAWATYTNNSWVISDGLITSSISAYSRSNIAFLRNDTSFTNTWLQTPYFSNAVDNISFYCRNQGTTSIQFQVLTSLDGTNWATQSTLTNIDNSFSYTRKAKIRFKGYDKSETLTNFPVLVALSSNIPGFAYSSFATTNGADLRFSDSNETITLNHEIDTWAPYDLPNPSNLLSSCSLWLRADLGVITNASGVITNWTDQSGNGNHLNITFDKPYKVTNVVNGLPVVRFDGTNDALRRASINNFPGTNWHIFFVQKTRKVQNNFLFFMPAQPGGRVGTHMPWPDNNVYWDCGGADGDARLVKGGLTTSNFSIWHYVSCNNGNRRQEIWQNGVKQASDTTAVTITTTNGISFSLASNGNSGPGEWACSDIAEFIIFRDDLAPDQQQEVGYYLSRKYGLASSYKPCTSYVWVQVPEITGSNSYIWAYWGGTNLNQPLCTVNGSTWDKNFRGVWHMAQPDALDSKLGNNGKNHGNINGEGIFGIGQAFNNNWMEIDNPNDFDMRNNLAVSAWMRVTGGWRSDWQTMVAKHGENNVGWSLRRRGNGNSGTFTQRQTSGDDDPSGTSNIGNGTWHHMYSTYDGATRCLYVDGKREINLADTGLIYMDTTPVSIGCERVKQYTKETYTWFAHRGYIDEVRIETTPRSSNWVWSAWYSMASNSAFCELTNVITTSASLTNWNPYSIAVTTPARYVRIFKNQATAAGQWLGLDNVAASAPAANITSPFISFAPVDLRFNYRVGGASGTMNVLASNDRENWTLIDGPLTGTPGAWAQYKSTRYLNYNYFRIENPSTNQNLEVSDFYVTQSSNSYFETFPGSALYWEDLAGVWRVDNAAQAWTRRGYPGQTVGFAVQTNYDEVSPNFPGTPPTWATMANGSASNLNWKHAEFECYSWRGIFMKIQHITGAGNLALDSLSFSSWHDTPLLLTNGWKASEVWVADYDAVNSNDHVVEFWKTRANPTNLQGLTTPYMTNGVGILSFDYKVANGPVTFEVKRTQNGDTNWWIPITNSMTTAYNASWKTFTLPINSDYPQYVRLEHTSSNSDVTYLTYEYYTYSPPAWGALPNFDLLTPVLSGPCTNFTTNQVVGMQTEYFAFRWTGRINLPFDGIWKFTTASDDGSKLYIDGSEVVNNDGGHGVIVKEGQINIAVAGWHDIEVQFFQGAGGVAFNPPQYAPPGGSLVNIPDSALIYRGIGAVLSINNVQISDYKARDEKMWWAYNALITSNQTDRTFDGRTCYLNNGPTNGTRPGVSLSYFNPCVQTPEMKNGIGELSFWYRRWDDTGTNAARIYVTASTNYSTADSQSSPLLELSGITNTEYRYFSTNFYILTNFYLRISSDTNANTSRFCIDNIGVFEPMAANIDIDNVTLMPEQPVYTNTVNVSATLKNFIFAPSNIVTRLYYYAGTNPWATNWPTTNWIPLDVVVNSNAYERTLKSSSFIPAFGIDTVVQYYVSCAFDGFFANNVSPKKSTNFTNPSWYTPINLNSNKPSTTPYYFVYSCPTGSAWINEFNYNYAGSGYTNEYVEICGKSGSILSNWHVKLIDTLYSTYGDYVITKALPYDTNGFGFWVVGGPAVTNIDAVLTNLTASGYMKSAGGIRLVRSMGAYDHAISYGLGAEGMTGFVYSAAKSWDWDAPIWLIGTNTTGMRWTNSLSSEGFWTPGMINSNQNLADYGNIPPYIVSITISNFSRISTNIYVYFITTATNDIKPSPWYCTNLLNTNWIPVPGPVYTNYYYQGPSSATYTQSFTLMTNHPSYFFKIVSTNAYY